MTITAGFKDKLILLPGYDEVAAGLSDLQLPSLRIPDLFVPVKYSTSIIPSVVQSSSPSKFPLTPRQRELSLDQTTLLSLSETNLTRNGGSNEPLTYSNIARASARKRSSSPPDLDWEATSASSDEIDEVPSQLPRITSRIGQGSRRPNPALVSSQLLSGTQLG